MEGSDSEWKEGNVRGGLGRERGKSEGWMECSEER